ncbi:hypothetical protein GQ53DRAFT_821859 [Thozetella sp. PMI_491]|nr:hypothetical protein GQ53DRAFT_821859 [Thozetella sp. PMI_491]
MSAPAPPLKPFFPAGTDGARAPESSEIQAVIDTLQMLTHIEGGYFVETDRDQRLVPSPFPPPLETATTLVPQRPGFDPAVRNASTTIFYLITPGSPQGNFHRNRARTVHTLHRGRGRYVLIHADENNRIETFVVGPNVAAGERLQWIVEGGKYKASFLLPDQEGGESSSGLLISETVVPGFEFCDHDFLTREGLVKLLGEDEAKDLEWLVRE